MHSLRRAGRGRWPLAESAVVAGFSVLVSWSFLRPGRLLANFDTLAYTTPNQAVAFEAMRAGRLPEWNPYVFGGAPHLANPQVGALYPLKLPLLGVSPHWAVVVLTVVHLVVLGVGVVVLAARSLGLGRVATLVAGLGAVGAGAVSTQLAHFEQIITIAWAPWLLVAVEATVSGRVRARRGAAAVGLLVGLMLLGGHQQPAYYLLCLVAAWTVGAAFDGRTWRPLVAVGGGVALGAGLAAAQLVPTLELVGRSVRSGGLSLSYVSVPEFLLAPRDVVLSLLGDPTSPVRPLSGETLAGLGVGVALLALVGAVTATLGFRAGAFRFRAAAALAAAGAALVLAMGPRTPLFRVAFGLVPGFALFRVPGRWVIVVALAAAVLAGLGAEAVAAGRPAAPVVAAAGALVLGLAALTLPFHLPGPRAVLWWALAAGAVCVAVAAATRPRSPAARRAALAVLVLVPAAELGSIAFHQGAFGPRVAAGYQSGTGSAIASFLAADGGRALSMGVEDFADPGYLVASMRPNINATLGVRSFDGYDGGPWVTRRWASAVEELTGQPFNPDLTLKSQLVGPPVPAVAARFGVRWLVVDTRTVDAAAVAAGWGRPSMTEGTLALFDNPDYRGEALMYPASVPARPGRMAAQVEALGASAPGTALVEGPGSGPCPGPCAASPLALRRGRPGRIAVGVEAAAPGLVVVAEGWDPGWRARVDGRPAPVEVAEGNLVAVAVGAGARSVELVYRTPGLGTGLGVSALSATAAIVLAAFPARRRGRRPTTGPGPEARAGADR